MKKSFHLHRHFYLPELILILTLSILLILTWLPSIGYFVFNGTAYIPALRASLYMTATSLIVVILLLFIKKELRSSELILGDDGVIKKTLYKVLHIPFEQIKAISFINLAVFRGVVVLETTQGKVYLTFAYKHVGEFVKQLKEHLIISGNNSCIEETRYQRILTESALSDQAHERARVSIVPLAYAMLALVMFNLVIAEVQWQLELSSILAWAFMGFIYPIGVFILAEEQHNRTIRRSPSLLNEKHRIKPNYLLTGFLVFIIYCITGILFRIYAS